MTKEEVNAEEDRLEQLEAELSSDDETNDVDELIDDSATEGRPVSSVIKPKPSAGRPQPRLFVGQKRGSETVLRSASEVEEIEPPKKRRAATKRNTKLLEPVFGKVSHFSINKNLWIDFFI